MTYCFCYQLASGKELIIRKRDDRHLYITTFSLALLISWAQVVTAYTNRKRQPFCTDVNTDVTTEIVNLNYIPSVQVHDTAVTRPLRLALGSATPDYLKDRGSLS